MLKPQSSKWRLVASGRVKKEKKKQSDVPMLAQIQRLTCVFDVLSSLLHPYAGILI